jgi:hypothetical protein
MDDLVMVCEWMDNAEPEQREQFIALTRQLFEDAHGREPTTEDVDEIARFGADVLDGIRQLEEELDDHEDALNDDIGTVWGDSQEWSH